MHVFYLHGFASSPDSGKARFFADRLAARGVRLWTPDLNQPAFETLTTTRMIEQVTSAIAALEPGPVAVIGSSLGAFVALHLAARLCERARAGDERWAARPVERLVLLAPAFDFGPGYARQLGAEALEQWQETGWLDVYHYADRATRRIAYALHEDALHYDSFATPLDVPALILQGRQDTVVAPAIATAFAEGRPNVRLLLLDDDHQLQHSLEVLWAESARFLGIQP
jgi:uncharacterized protein